MRWPGTLVFAAMLATVLFTAGCAAPARTGATHQPEFWRGRLAVRLESEPAPTPAQSFAAEFELRGTALDGELTLYTPFGNTAAALSWSPLTATLRSQGEVRHFESLDALVKQAVGTELPVPALFAWLAGEHMSVAGWSADLSQHAHGRITARRTVPGPPAELRLVLEK